MTRTVLVTGGSGGLGRALLPRLRAAGWRCRCLVHRHAVSGADEVVEGDLTDVASLGSAARGVDAVIHLAAVTHARTDRAYRAANLDGTRHLVEAAGQEGISRFVHVSTRAISPDGGAYSRSKRAAEAVIASSGLVYTTIRLPEIYGLSGAEGVDRIVDRARRGGTIYVVAGGLDEICPVFVDDAITPLVAALDSKAAAMTVYTLAGDCVTVREFATTCIGAFGSTARVISVPGTVVSALGRLGRTLPIPVFPDQLARLRSPKPPPSPEAREQLGFDPRPLGDGLRLLRDTYPGPDP